MKTKTLLLLLAGLLAVALYTGCRKEYFEHPDYKKHITVGNYVDVRDPQDISVDSVTGPHTKVRLRSFVGPAWVVAKDTVYTTAAADYYIIRDATGFDWHAPADDLTDTGVKHE
jgi:hypothetical protein